MILIQSLLDNFFRVLDFYWSLPTNENNRNDCNPGGYLTVLDGSSGQLLISFQMTNDQSLSFEETEDYRGYSLEKARRLFKCVKVGHLTSYESRDLPALQYGGAILTNRFVVSFSGLPEEWDTIIVSIGSYFNGWLDEDGLREIAKRIESDQLMQLWMEAVVQLRQS